MNYTITTIPENVFDNDSYRYVIRFKDFTITSNRSYKHKITAHRKAKEAVNQLLDWKRRPEMIINICGGRAG
jgi:hypothetical protein